MKKKKGVSKKVISKKKPKKKVVRKKVKAHSKKKIVKKVHKKPVKKIKKPTKHHVKKEGFFEEFTDLFHHKKTRKRKPVKKSRKNSHKKVKKKAHKKVHKKPVKKVHKKPIKKTHKKVKHVVHKHVKKVHKHKKISKKHVKKTKRHVKKVHKKPVKIISKKPMGKKGSIKKPMTKHHAKKEGFFEGLTDIFSHKKNKKQKLEKDLKKIESKTKKVSKGKGVRSKGIKKLNKKIVTKPIIKSNKKIEKIKKDIKKPIKIAKVVNKIKKDIAKKQAVKKPLKTGKLGAGPPILTGITGFDTLFEGKTPGIPQGASILIEGGPGSGKTLFCLTTLYNLCKKGKKCLYMSFEEPEERLIHHMENFGWNPRELIRKGKLRITRFDAIDVSRSIEALLSAAKKELLIDIDPVFFPQDFNADFVVIDSLTSIASAFSGEKSRFRIYMEQLFRYLEKNKIANFLIREVSSPSHIGTTFKEQGEAVSFLSDGIVVIYNVIYDSGQRSSAIEILKMRGVNFNKKIVELKIIDGKGLEVNPRKILNKTKKANFSLT